MRAERKEDERRDKWRGNGAFCLIMFEGRTESPEQSYRKKLNIFMNLFSLSSLAAAGGSNHVTLDWLAGWLGGRRGGPPPPQRNPRFLVTLSPAEPSAA